MSLDWGTHVEAHCFGATVLPNIEIVHIKNKIIFFTYVFHLITMQIQISSIF